MRQTALNTVYKLAESNPRIIFIGSDLGHGTLETMRKSLPKQFFMEGISEQHIVGFAAGLAKQGFIPFINTIANFMSRRAIEQIILDVALHKLPVKILASGGGMVYAPLGPTHTATDDLAHVLGIPNLNVFAPCDANEMEEIITRESLSSLPSYIRFGKGGEKIVSSQLNLASNLDFRHTGSTHSKMVIVTTGIAVQPCLDAINTIESKSRPSLIHLLKLNLKGNRELAERLTKAEKVLVVEEHQERGGLLTELLHFKLDHKYLDFDIHTISLGTEFIRKYGSQNDHLVQYGISVDKIKSKLINN